MFDIATLPVKLNLSSTQHALHEVSITIFYLDPKVYSSVLFASVAQDVK